MIRPRHRRHRGARPPLGALLLAAVGALVVLALGGTGTLGGWAAASLANSTNTAAAGSVGISHTYGTNPTCSAGIRVTTTTACSGTLVSGAVAAAAPTSSTDVIANTGTARASRLQQTLAATGCAPVQLANRKNTGNPMVARYGVTFHPGGSGGGPMDDAGYVTLDGANPGGYATSVVQQSQPPTGAFSVGVVSGVGVWFKAAAGRSGPLMTFAADGANGSGSADRTFYLDSAGKVDLVWNTSGSKITSTNSASLADGNWHFVYATFGGVNVAVIGLIPQVTLTVDGGSSASTPLVSLSPLSSYTGYWHVGWAPTSVTGLASAYFAGSLSNAVVINAGTIPTGSSIGKPTTQAAFNSATSGSTEHWLLNDPGTTTFTGTLPVVGAANAAGTASAACQSVDLGLTTTPAGAVADSTTSLYTMVTAGTTLSAPDPGSSQTTTLKLSHSSGYNSYVAGLHLWVPMTSTVSTLPGGKWPLTFTWTPTASTTIVPTP